jgi:hypothetical protein
MRQLAICEAALVDRSFPSSSLVLLRLRVKLKLKLMEDGGAEALEWALWGKREAFLAPSTPL